MSNKDKKDITRIEDLGEFIHELGGEEDFLPPDELPSDMPDLPEEDSFLSPSNEETPSLDFGTTEEVPSFESSEDSFSSLSEEAPSEEAIPFEESGLEFSTETSGETTSSFETSNFSTDSFTTSEEESSFSVEEVPVREKPSDEIFSSSWEESGSANESSSEEMPYTPSSDFKTPENFEDLKKFAENSSLGGMATEGNPSFSVLIKNVRYIEDVQDIITLLRELNLLNDPEEQMKSRLMRGMLLVPRISEFAAIFLCHKLRRFDIDVLMGLSDEIHPPKHQETPEAGIISKANLFQNQSHQFQFENPRLDVSQVIVAATQNLEGHQVVRYMGVASEHKMLDSTVVEDEGSSEIPRHYQELANKLKAHALKNHANAVVGLNYQLTPLPDEFGMGGHKYRLTCTGNLVWVNKL